MEDNRIKTEIAEEVEKMADQMKEMAMFIFNHPELGFQEVLSSACLADYLEKNGFTVERGILGMPTAFRAVFRKSEGPKVAFLAEYDCLPKLGHACGHNLFGTAAAAAGVALSRHMQEGEVFVFGTPAEEGAVDDAGGKVPMAEAGLFDDMDAVITCHAEGRTILKQDLISRAVLELDFHGKPAHAAGAPEKGVNALDAAVIAYTAISALRQQLTPDVRVHGIIVDGGQMINTIPAFARMRFGVRTEKPENLDAVIEKVLNCARAGALATGCTFEYRHMARAYYTLKHNDRLLQSFAENLNFLQEPYIDHIASSYSTDTGNVSLKAPTIHPYISIGGEHLVGHTEEFARASSSDSGFKGMILAAKAMAMTGLDVLGDTSLRQESRKEFLQGME